MKDKSIKIKKTQILFAAFEAAPFIKTGGLGDVAGSLPAALSKDPEIDIRVFLPKLAQIPSEYADKMEFLSSFSVPLSWRTQYCGLFKLVYDGVIFYFVDNEYYFNRSQVYGEFDDGERTAFYSKAVLEAVLHLDDFAPDIIHANDWHAALIPVFLREFYNETPKLKDAKTIFTIHNLKFQGKYSADVIGDVCGLCGTPAEWQLDQLGAANYLQGASIYSDMVTTVSPTYAEEICMPYFGEGLDWLFATRRDRGSLKGILNGIDNDLWNPETDEYIDVHYNLTSIRKKAENKLSVQKELGLPQDKNIPMFVLISRLTEQKGLDLLTYDLPKIVDSKMQLVILGIGDYKYEEAFKWYAARFPEVISIQTSFNNPLSHRLYAGADVLLMPSRFEPCGLSQMMAMRYGTLPLVRETGGLKDSVKPYPWLGDESTGFSFLNFNAHEMMASIETALDVWYNHKDVWDRLISNAMRENFSWDISAEEYKKMYMELLDK